MVKTILKNPNKLLRSKSKEVHQYDAKLKKLAQDMKDTLQSSGGVGLAAIQIGEAKRVVLIAPKDAKSNILVNPVIVEKVEEQDSREGCLSVPKNYGTVKRAKQVTITYNTLDGEPKTAIMVDDEARILQHEIDHLDGILFIDHLENV